MTIQTETINSLEPGNSQLAKQVLEEVISQGVREFCLCAGARNAPFVYPLVHSDQVKVYHWPEERSAAFFALGRIKATGCPVAVITTSGTAAAEIIPAAMEAHYTGLPLVLITADRPRRFRGTGAPQSAEQIGLFGCYAHYMQDLAEEDLCDLTHWARQGPVHLNVCFEEPRDADCQRIRLDPIVERSRSKPVLPFSDDEQILSFFQRSRYPLVVVGALHPYQHEAAVQFLLHLKAPLYAEGISGIREDPRLEALRITRMEKVWSVSKEHGYPIDGILRLGGVPTIRLWRDLELKEGKIPVCSVSEHPFSGLSCAGVIHTSLKSFFEWAQTIPPFRDYPYFKWKEADTHAQQALIDLFYEEPLAEQSFIHFLSKGIPKGSKLYLGNSLPIREWDLGAVYEPRGFQISCSRGVNGIDGQVSTFLGYSSSEQENWAILGDLTLLYDLAGPWVTSQLPGVSATIALINNSGAGIFTRMFSHPAFYNCHSLTFGSIAEFWKWKYEKLESVPGHLLPFQGGRLIELIPNLEATDRFLKKFKDI